MATTFKEFFVAERAKALTQVIVTRREDLAIKEIKEDGTFDYFLCIRRENSYDLCRIGLVVKAAMTFGAQDETSSQLKETAERIYKIGSCSFPVVLFYFTAKDDRGFFAWIWEPEIDESGTPKLSFQSSPSLRDLNDKSLDEIVNTSEQWYDAVHMTLTK
jgi:hypothetical protein